MGSEKSVCCCLTLARTAADAGVCLRCFKLFFLLAPQLLTQKLIEDLRQFNQMAAEEEEELQVRLWVGLRLGQVTSSWR